MSQSPTTKQARPVAWGLARGESLVASAGIMLAIVVVGVLAASAGWTLYTYRHSLERGREDQVKTAAMLVAHEASISLAVVEPSQTRQLLAEVAAQSNLSECSIKLLDGTVIADADPSKISKSALRIPPSFPGGQGKPDNEVTVEHSADGKTLHVSVPVNVRGRGRATLQVSAGISYPIWADWQTQAGIGVIAVCGMGGLLLGYRRMRRRLRGLGAIGDALRWAARGETSSGALMVSDGFGPEAQAWNKLLSERDSLRDQAALEKAAEKLATRSGSDGDLASACDALWTGMVVLGEDAQGGGACIKYANGAAGVLLRRKRDELVGAALASVIEDQRVAEAITSVVSAAPGAKARQRTSVDLERRSEAGDRTILRLTARPLRREDLAAAILVIEDVTQQRVADESRNAFVAQATHELRTPLTNIRLYVETMIDEGENDPLVRTKCINVISQEAKRLERIVADMLSVSEIEAGSLRLNPGEIRLDALFEELESDFKAQAEDKEIKLKFELPPKFPIMQGDRDKILLALNNLVGNALKYTPTGGAVTVHVEAGQSLAVDVTDNGIGISPEEQELVFEKFYRAKDRRISGITGSGIGLALARQVVRLHNGDITVKSQLDKGSTFTMTVPLSAGAGAKPMAKAA